MAHEIGHVLGFNHPDTFKEANLAATAPMGPATCLEPLNHVELASYPEGYDSIMFSMSKHRDRTCLTADDVQGLHFLYPMCDGVAPEPSCIKERRTSGWLRLLITVALPYFLMSIFLVILITTVRCHQRRQLKELEERVEKVRERGRILTDFLYSMGTAAANTPANMRRQSSGGLDGAGGSGVGTPRRGFLGRIGSGLARSRSSFRRGSEAATQGQQLRAVDEQGEASLVGVHERGAAPPPPPGRTASQEEEERQMAAAIAASLGGGGAPAPPPPPLPGRTPSQLEEEQQLAAAIAASQQEQGAFPNALRSASATPTGESARVSRPPTDPLHEPSPYYRREPGTSPTTTSPPGSGFGLRRGNSRTAVGSSRQSGDSGTAARANGYI